MSDRILRRAHLRSIESVTRILIDSVLPQPGGPKVPEITLLFWLIKLQTTAGGEATADYFASRNLLLGAVVEAAELAIAASCQRRIRRYFAPAYWLFAQAIAIFGTSVFDVMHRTFGVAHVVTSIFWITVLAVVLFVWHRSERSLSIHTVFTRRREMFY